MSRNRRADTDHDLVADLQRGDLAAFSEIVVRYQQVVCAVAFSACGRQALSEDVAQETFVAAWKNIDKLEDSNKLKSWLCSIARNRARDVLRKRRREVLTEDGDGQSAEFQTSTSDAPSPHDLAVTVEEEGRIWEALQNIPEGYRETLVLFYRDGQSIHQVAEGLDLSIAAVKQRLSRGRAALRDSLGRVSHCLARTQPSKAFTVGVIAAVAAQSGVAAASAASVSHSTGAQGATGASKGGVYSFGFSSMAALILALSGLLVWTLLDLAPVSNSQRAPALAATEHPDRALGGPHAEQSPATGSEVARQEFRIEGKVIDLFRRGVAGATVAIGGDAQRTTTTDKDGRFHFAGIERGAVAIQARTRDGASRPIPLHVDEDTEEVMLQLVEGSTLEIELRDGRGGPVLPGIDVQLESESILLNATTDRDGRATFRAITTPMNFAVVQATGFASSKLQILLSTQPGLHKRTLALHRGVPLSGVVRDEEGRALSGAKIIVHGAMNSPLEDSTKSDEEGRWSFDTVSREDSMLVATHEDYAWVTTSLSLEGVQTAATRDLVMPKGRSARGKVVYSDGTPAAYALVRSQPSGKPVTTDAEGNFTIRGLEPSDSGVYAKHKIYGTITAPLQVDRSTNDIRLVLEDQSVRGLVRDESGRPVAGAQLQLSSLEVDMMDSNSPMVFVNGVTNSRGEFSIGPVPSETEFDLVAVMPRVSPAYLGMNPLKALRVRAGQHKVALVLDAPGRVVGRVVAPDGQPVEEFALILANYAEALETEASSPFSGTSGEFVLSDVPRGSYAMAIVAKGYKPKLLKEIVVGARGSAELGVVTLQRGTVLRGRVVDAAGKGVAGARVVTGSQMQADSSRVVAFNQRPDDGADPFMFTSSADREVFSDANGNFELTNMHSRRGKLYAVAELAQVGRSRMVEVSKRGKKGLIVALEATGEVSGTILGGGKDLAVTAMHKLGSSRPNERPFIVSTEPHGRDFAFRQLTPGTYVFSAHSAHAAADWRTAVEVEVVAGQNVSVHLEPSLKNRPPWDSEALEAYATQVKAFCECTSNACRQAAQEGLREIGDAHEEVSGPDFETLVQLDETRDACQE